MSDLNEFFETLWCDSRDSRHTASRVRGPANILTSIPDAKLDSCPEGATEILQELERALDSAQSIIYIEHQYLSSRKILHALREALNRAPNLEIILVLNQNPDLTAYARWQLAGLTEFGLIDHPRVGLFALWSLASKRDGRRDINQVFVHSKVITIDDRWAMCGSANLDGVSLHSYGADFSGLLGRTIFDGVRSFELAVVTEGSSPTDGGVRARDLRHRLWQEHIGHSLDLFWNGQQPDGLRGGKRSRKGT